jgi:hypothetical protein
MSGKLHHILDKRYQHVDRLLRFFENTAEVFLNDLWTFDHTFNCRFSGDYHVWVDGLRKRQWAFEQGMTEPLYEQVYSTHFKQTPHDVFKKLF